MRKTLMVIFFVLIGSFGMIGLTQGADNTNDIVENENDTNNTIIIK